MSQAPWTVVRVRRDRTVEAHFPMTEVLKWRAAVKLSRLLARPLTSLTHLRHTRQLREANEATRLAMLYNNIGMAYAGLQQWEQAENFYRDSIQRWQQLNNDRSCVNTMDNLGELYLQWHQKERALAILAEAYEIALTLDDRHLRQLVAEHLDRARKL